MTQVKIDIGKLDANGIVDLANDPIIITPTKRFTTSTKKIIVNEPLKTTLDQHGAITLNLPPTGTDWAYQLTVDNATAIAALYEAQATAVSADTEGKE